MSLFLRTLGTAGALAIAATVFTTGTASADDTPSQVTTADGVVVTTFANGAVTRFAPEGSAEAADTGCGGIAVCFWTKTSYKGDKYTVAVEDRGCWDVYPSQPDKYLTVKSLKTANTVIAAMRTKQKCKGTPSMSYNKHANVPNTTFDMRSFS